jgi:hypothetical protein
MPARRQIRLHPNYVGSASALTKEMIADDAGIGVPEIG